MGWEGRTAALLVLPFEGQTLREFPVLFIELLARSKRQQKEIAPDSQSVRADYVSSHRDGDCHLRISLHSDSSSSSLKDVKGSQLHELGLCPGKKDSG